MSPRTESMLLQQIWCRLNKNHLLGELLYKVLSDNFEETKYRTVMIL